MSQAEQLIFHLQRAQERLLLARFVAPCLPPKARLRTRVEGLVYTFQAYTEGFEGWGVFVPRDPARAVLVGEASFSQVDDYLRRCRCMEMRLVRPLQGHSWLAYPIHQGGPAVVHLVSQGSPWQACRVHSDGCQLWYGGQAPNADPRLGDLLKSALLQETAPEDLGLPGLTPREREAYSLEYLHRCKPKDEKRLQHALARGGGRLGNYLDQGDSWLVHWNDSLGQLHSSTIRKHDLGVVCAGVCLSGEDHKFDLTSLVGVVEGFE